MTTIPPTSSQPTLPQLPPAESNKTAAPKESRLGIIGRLMVGKDRGSSSFEPKATPVARDQIPAFHGNEPTPPQPPPRRNSPPPQAQVQSSQFKSEQEPVDATYKTNYALASVIEGIQKHGEGIPYPTFSSAEGERGTQNLLKSISYYQTNQPDIWNKFLVEAEKQGALGKLKQNLKSANPEVYKQVFPF